MSGLAAWCVWAQRNGLQEDTGKEVLFRELLLASLGSTNNACRPSGSPRRHGLRLDVLASEIKATSVNRSNM